MGAASRKKSTLQTLLRKDRKARMTAMHTLKKKLKFSLQLLRRWFCLRNSCWESTNTVVDCIHKVAPPAADGYMVCCCTQQKVRLVIMLVMSMMMMENGQHNASVSAFCFLISCLAFCKHFTKIIILLFDLFCVPCYHYLVPRSHCAPSPRFVPTQLHRSPTAMLRMWELSRYEYGYDTTTRLRTGRSTSRVRECHTLQSYSAFNDVFSQQYNRICIMQVVSCSKHFLAQSLKQALCVPTVQPSSQHHT